MTVQETRTATASKAVDHLRRTQKAQDDAELTRISAENERLAQRFAGEKQKIVSMEIDQKLKDRAAAHRLPEDASREERQRRHAQQMAYAAEIGVDLAALNRMRADFGAQARKINALPYQGDFALSMLPGSRQEPELATAKRNYNGSWDPGWQTLATNASKFSVWNADTYFDTVTNRAGSHIRFRQRETDDYDTATMWWRNGYMVLYTPATLRHLVIDVALVPQISRFFIDTDNEPGSSSCTVQLHQSIRVEVYSDWSDAVPQEITVGQLSYTGTSNPEAWIDSQAFQPWSQWNARVTTQRQYAAGNTLAIFVSEMNYASGVKLDDTRLTAGVNAAWYLDNIVVSPLW